MTAHANAFLFDTTSAAPVSHPLTLAALQETVGGYIEAAFTIPSPTRQAEGIAVTGYVNDEGLIIGLPVSVLLGNATHMQPMAGPLLVCGLDTRSGETVPLDAEELDWIEQQTMLLAAGGQRDAFTVVHLLKLA